MSSGVVWWYLRVSQVFFGLRKGRATSWSGTRLQGQQVLCYLLCMLLQFFHVQNTIKDQLLQLPEGHTNINIWGTLVDGWWTVSLIAIILTGQGQNGHFRPLSSAVCAHLLPARSCSLKIGALQKAAIVPEDECCLMSIFLWHLNHSLLIWDFTFLCSSGLSFLQLRRSSNVCSWK